MELKDEREILKQINRLEKTKRQVEEFEVYDQKIKDRKAKTATLRESLKIVGATVSTLRIEHYVRKSAEQLGCNVEELLGMKLDCPENKIGSLIGKKGSTMKQIMEKAKVNVDINRHDGNVRILGCHDALGNACEDIGRIIATIEKSVEVSPDLIAYLTAKNITALTELRSRHPYAHLAVNRSSTQVRIRGIAKDIETVEEDLLSFDLTQKELRAAPSESLVVVGKQGATIERLILSHQTTIDVKRKDEEDSVITIAGPADRVETAVREIELMLSANKEISLTVAVDPNVRAMFLLKSGEGIKNLNKKVNEATSEKNCFFGLSMGDDGVVVRGKAKAMQMAIDIVEESSREVEASIVRIKVDPFAIPAFIGKGGMTMKKLRDGKLVNVEMDRIVGEIVLCGPDPAEVETLEKSFRSLAAEHLVERISVDTPELKSLYRELIRSKVGKEVSDLVFPGLDEADSVILLRGDAESVKKASEVVNGYLSKHYTQDIQLSKEDMDSLLSGGKNSMVAKLSGELGVRLNSDRDRSVIEAKGEMEKVKSAYERINRFLHGGEGLVVTKIALDEQLVGVIIGKRGRTKAELEQKFDKVSVVVHRDENSVTLRGPQVQTEDCRSEILKLISAARVTQVVEISEAQQNDVAQSKITREISQSLSVQVSTVDGVMKVRGSAADVRYAVSLIKEQLSGVYESCVDFETAMFRRLSDACRDPVHFQRIEKASGAKVFLDSDNKKLLVRGKRADVKSAKVELVRFFQLLFSSNFLVLEVPGLMAASGRDTLSLGDVAAVSGAAIQLDRDTNALFILSADISRVKKAAEILNTKLQATKKVAFVLHLDASEDWLIASIIGKKGARIKSLRKELGCNIDISSKERKVTVTADDAELVNKARAMLEQIVDDEQKSCVFVQIPEKDMPAFVGRSGAHITKFAQTHSIDVQVIKNMSSTVRLMGDAKAVFAAKAAATDWLAARDKAKNVAILQMDLKKYQIPAVIGTKGSNIRELEQEFGCKVKIDRTELKVAVHGGTEKGREGALAKIKEIAAGKVHSNEGFESLPESDSTENTTTEVGEARNETKKKKTKRSRSHPSPEEKVNIAPLPPIDLAPSIEAVVGFPALPTKVKEVVDFSVAGAATPSAWASMLSKDETEKPKLAMDAEAEESILSDNADAEESVLSEDAEAEGSMISKDAVAEKSILSEDVEGEESMISKDAVADESILSEDAEAEESVISKDAVADESILSGDAEAEESVITKDLVAEESILSEDVEAEISKDALAEESILSEYLEAEESVITKDAVAEESLLSEDAEAEESVITKDLVAEESTLSEDAEAEEPVITKDLVAEESTLSEDAEAEESIIFEAKESTISNDAETKESTPFEDAEAEESILSKDAENKKQKSRRTFITMVSDDEWDATSHCSQGSDDGLGGEVNGLEDAQEESTLSEDAEAEESIIFEAKESTISNDAETKESTPFEDAEAEESILSKDAENKKRTFITMVSDDEWDATSHCSQGSDDGLGGEVNGLEDAQEEVRKEINAVTIACLP